MKLKLDEKGNVVVEEKNGVKLPVYVHDDGKEVAFDAAATVTTISRLNGEAKTNRERAEAAEGALKPFKDAGISDPVAAAKALTTVKNLDDKKLVDAGEVEKVKAEAIKAVEEKYSPIVKERDTYKGQLESNLVDAVFTRSKFIADKFAAPGPAGVEVARALFARHFKVEDGKIVAVDANGQKLFSRSNPGNHPDAEEAIELIVDAYPHKAHILKGTGASGGGAQAGHGGNNGKSSMTRTAFEALSPADKQASIKAGATITD